MARSRSIAVAQTCPIMGDIQANLDEHIRLARLASMPDEPTVWLGVRLAKCGSKRLLQLRKSNKSASLIVKSK